MKVVRDFLRCGLQFCKALLRDLGAIIFRGLSFGFWFQF